MIGLGGMGNRWGVVMVILNSYLCCVKVIWFIRYCNKWWNVRGRYDECTVLRPITNAQENRLWEHMKKDMGINGGTYVAMGVMVGGGKCYLQCWDVRWVMCMGWSVREDVCFHTCIWIELLIFYSAACFVMGRWW